MTMTKFSRINKQREEITMRVLEDMEKGGNEWKKPWVEASPLPLHNPVSGTQYSGRNFLYTYVYGMMRGYADPRWATEKQIKDMDAEKSEGADTVLAETFNSIDALSTDAAIDLLRVYSNCDASGRDAVAKTFYALSGESFDSYLMTASEVCKKTLGMLEPEPPQPAKTKNLSQKTMSSREAPSATADQRTEV